jgi:PHD/YefM family antitoxin component YafN of YafNO toxin-antitoxin module
MKSWSITEARARIADVFDAAIAQGPQRIERRDSEPVVMVAESDWNRLIAEYPTLADLILKAPLEADDLPKRRPARVLSSDGD